jgi:hypothetical protein
VVNVSIPLEFAARFEQMLKVDEMPLQQLMRVWAAILFYLGTLVCMGKAVVLTGIG